MADSSNPHSTGCLGRILNLWILLFMSGMVLALGFIAIPQDLTDIGGYEPTPGADAREARSRSVGVSPTPRPTPGAQTREPRDLEQVLQAALRHGHPLALSEKEINRWLDHTLKTRQGGMLADHVSLDRVWIRLDDGIAEIIMERRIMGRPFTLSMFVLIEQIKNSSGARTVINRHGGRYLSGLPKPLRGGRFGSLVVPQGFLNMVVPAFGELAALYDEELKLALESMAVVRIEKNRLVLKPRPADGPPPARSSTF